MVVTDDQGRYVVPDLPKASYNIWVRGYGLVDSPKVKAARQKSQLESGVAPTEAAAAQYYPAIYWYSMMKIPDASEFGGKGAIPAKITQSEWLNSMKNNGCVDCHQMGQLPRARSRARYRTRSVSSLPPRKRGSGASSPDNAANRCSPSLSRTGRCTIEYFADWTDRIAKGELPLRSPRDRKESSATSSLPPGIG